MKTVSKQLLIVAALAMAAASIAPAQDKATKEAADKLHAAALQEPDSGKAAEMLCKAAAMVPKNSAATASTCLFRLFLPVSARGIRPVPIRSFARSAAIFATCGLLRTRSCELARR